MGYQYRTLNIPPDVLARADAQLRKVIEADEAEQARREAEEARQRQWEIDDAVELLRENGYIVTAPSTHGEES